MRRLAACSIGVILKIYFSKSPLSFLRREAVKPILLILYIWVEAFIINVIRAKRAVIYCNFIGAIIGALIGALIGVIIGVSLLAGILILIGVSACALGNGQICVIRNIVFRVPMFIMHVFPSMPIRVYGFSQFAFSWAGYL